MDALKEDPELLFHELSAHLSQISESPQTPFDADLLKRAERSLDASTPRQNLWTILQTGESLLQTLQQDPRPLTRLLGAVIHLIPFDDLKTTITPTTLLAGLNSPSPPIQLLCLAYLSRAASTPSGASFVAASSSLVARLISTWLGTDSTEVADTALSTLTALLTVDQPSTTTKLTTSTSTSGSATGQGLLWRRLFHDPEVYTLFFAWTTLSPSLSHHPNPTTKPGIQATTLSQARLYDFLSRAAPLDWATISTSTLPEIETPYLQPHQSTQQPYGGLLRYAASHMIDPADYLMNVLRQDFFIKLLQTLEEQQSAQGQQPAISPRLLKAIQDDAGLGDDETGAREGGGLHL